MFNVILYYDKNITKHTLEKLKIKLVIAYTEFVLIAINQEQKDELNNLQAVFLERPDLDQLLINGRPLQKEKLSLPANHERKTYILQFKGPIKKEWLTDIETYGKIKPYATFAHLNSEEIEKLQSLAEVHWIGNYCNKCHLKRSDTNITVANYFPWAKDHKKRELVDSDQTAADDNLICVESYPVPELFNLNSRKINNVNNVHKAGYTGSNQEVAITDTGIYKDHQDFGTLKVIDFVGDGTEDGGDGNGHGTHVAGTACAKSSSFYYGHAPDANLISVKVFNNNGGWGASYNIKRIFEDSYKIGARINNNSWGSQTNSVYTTIDRDTDVVCCKHRDYVIVIAAGNAGPNTMTLGSPASSKNSIVVGSCQTTQPDALSKFSSRGPTRDGRIKPDLLAPGENIMSTQNKSTNQYTTLSGTSMATPQISGAVALLKAYLVDENPSSALIKALLINGATEIPDEPRTSQGWGRINVERSMPNSNQREITYWDNDTSPNVGEFWSTKFTVPANTPLLKITLVWIDPVAAPGAQEQLVNNLNLKITDPNGTFRFGNDDTVPDQKNNVECVNLTDPEEGVYELKVISSEMSEQDYGFALVVGLDNSENEDNTELCSCFCWL